ncbi:MAG: right-handed parallel beta-helix repeat-containing protein [Luteolibacter sp.]
MHKFIPLFSFLLTCSLSAEKKTIVVSLDSPIATLEDARLKVREIKQQQPDQAIEVLIKGGVYPLLETVVFGVEDSGTEDAPIVYKASPGEEPVFTGGVSIGGWEKVSSDPTGTPEAARGKLWVAEIPKSPGKEWYIRSLYDGETLLNRAISGKLYHDESDGDRANDYNMQGKKIVRELDYESEPVKPFERFIKYKGDDIRDWENLYDIEILLKDRPWLRNVIPLESVDPENKILLMAADPTYQPVRPHLPYWIENAIDYLDEPGEWVVNTKEGLIYMWPEGDVSEMNVVAPLLQEFIRVEGKEDGLFAKHLHFEGLTFMHGLRDTMLAEDKGLQHDWEMYDKGNAIIRFRNVEDSSVKRCTIKSSSGTGIRLDLHSQRNELISNHLKYLGGTGIVLSGYGPGTKDVNKNNIVHDNYIHHVGEILNHSPAIFITQSGHNKITHNTIHDLPYNGIVVSGCRPDEFYLVKRIPFRRAWLSTIRFEECEPYILKGLQAKSKISLSHFLPLLHARENHIGMNDISRTLLELHDGNAIYFSAMGENNLVEHNYLHKNYDTAGTLRLDDNPSYTIIRENVITEAQQGFGLKDAAEVTNNFVFTETFLRGRSTPGWLGGTKRVIPKGNIFMPSASSESGNGLYLTDDRATNKPFYENLPKMENSIYFTRNTSPAYVPKDTPGSDLFTGEQVIPGKDSIKLLYADPMFDEEAMKTGIYRFKEGSPVEKLGIKPIDLRKVGSSLAKASFGGLSAKSKEKGREAHFNFVNKSPFDQAGLGASMTVDGTTITTVNIIDMDGVSKGSTTTVHAGLESLGIVSASGNGDHKNFDAGEAWQFQFDADIASLEMEFADLEDEDVLTLSFPDGADDYSTKISSSSASGGTYSLKWSIPAGTPMRLELTEGNTVRIKSFGVGLKAP